MGAHLPHHHHLGWLPLRLNRTFCLFAGLFFIAGFAHSAIADATNNPAQNNGNQSDVTNDNIESITVYGQSLDDIQHFVLEDDHGRHGHADSAALFKQFAGVSVNENGPLSGQIQYRGLFGPHTSVRINGLKLPSGGPNWMDPPMHYMTNGLLDKVSLKRGIAGVDEYGIGAQAQASWKQPEYQADSNWQNFLNINSHYRDNGNAGGLAGTIGMANDRFRLNIAASDETSNDYDVPRGEVTGTEYERQIYGLAFGYKGELYAADFSYHTIASDDAGTPTLPLDIDFFNTDLWQASIARNIDHTNMFDTARIKLSVGGSKIKHGMENFNLRPAPNFSNLPLPPFAGPDARRVRVTADTLEARLRLELNRGQQQFAFGVDYQQSEHNASVTDPDFTPFFVTNFSDAQQDSIALYGKWQTQITARTQLELGLRFAQVEDDTNPVNAFPAQLVDNNPTAFPAGTPPRAVWVLRERFNQLAENNDLDIEETTTDWTMLLTHQLTDPQRSSNMAISFGLARKTRTPLYLERYLWIPLEINAGLGDGNNYVGNPNLNPEVAHQADLGFSWQGTTTANSSNQFYLRPSVFYHQIDDYIQGSASQDPITIAVSANANGDATPQQFNNVDAEIYGFDMAFGWQFSPALRLDGNAAWVRGKRRDINDNLYRIAPPSLELKLTWERGAYRISFSQVMVARQDNLSASLTLDPQSPANSFTEVGGYSLSNIHASVDANDHWSIDLGIENLFDKHYRDPLSGFNRNANNGIAVGERLPGRGRNVFLRVGYTL